mgnify:CR=1 FL=1
MWIKITIVSHNMKKNYDVPSQILQYCAISLVIFQKKTIDLINVKKNYNCSSQCEENL